MFLKDNERIHLRTDILIRWCDCIKVWFDHISNIVHQFGVRITGRTQY